MDLFCKWLFFFLRSQVDPDMLKPSLMELKMEPDIEQVRAASCCSSALNDYAHFGAHRLLHIFSARIKLCFLSRSLSTYLAAGFFSPQEMKPILLCKSCRASYRPPAVHLAIHIFTQPRSASDLAAHLSFWALWFIMMRFGLTIMPRSMLSIFRGKCWELCRYPAALFSMNLATVVGKCFLRNILARKFGQILAFKI